MNLKEEIIDKINELALRADYELEMLEKFNPSTMLRIGHSAELSRSHGEQFGPELTAEGQSRTINVSLKEEIKNQLFDLRQEAVKIRQKKIENEIMLAEKNKNEKQKQNLIKQFDQLSKELL